jgi:hypothetical protein
LSPLYYRHRNATALDAPERILSRLPKALKLPIEGTETLAASPFCGQLSGAQIAPFQLKANRAQPGVNVHFLDDTPTPFVPSLPGGNATRVHTDKPTNTRLQVRDVHLGPFLGVVDVQPVDHTNMHRQGGMPLSLFAMMDSVIGSARTVLVASPGRRWSR